MPKKKIIEQRSRQQRWQEKQHAAGLCPRCGAERRDFNPKTGKPYFFGPNCRKRSNAQKALYMAARRAAGKDRWLNERNERGN